MAKYRQSANDRLDESRGDSRRGREQAVFNIPDNRQAGEVRYVNTNSQQYDLNRIRPYECGSRGYPAEAWNYKW